jgi:molybdopterin converting factor small subunit
VGAGRLSLELSDGSTLNELFNLLASEHPALTSLRPYTSFAVNREVVDPLTILRAGDEVALIQPVSGG